MLHQYHRVQILSGTEGSDVIGNQSSTKAISGLVTAGLDGDNAVDLTGVMAATGTLADEGFPDASAQAGDTVIGSRGTSFSLTAQNTASDKFDSSKQASSAAIAATSTGPHVLGFAPAYNWYHGCAPTAVASVFGYYDVHGYPAYFTADGWNAVCLTVNVQDQISSPAHNAKYDPKPDDPNLPTPTATSIADFLQTSTDPQDLGWTWLSAIDSGIEGYAAYRGYAVKASDEYYSSQTWGDVTADIDAGHPLAFLVDTNADDVTDHFVPVFGYDNRADGSHWFACYTTWSEDETLVWYPFVPMASGTSWGVYSVTHVLPLSSPQYAPPSTPDLLAASDSGKSNHDDITNVSTPTFIGTGVPGATITLWHGTTAIGNGTVAADGIWSATATKALTEGANAVSATQTDAGNTSVTSGVLNVTLDTILPVPTGVTASGTGITNGSGHLTTGATVTLALTMSEAVSLDTGNGSPTLALNDNGAATYVSGSGSNTLSFRYTVAAGQNTPDLTVTGVNLNGATMKDAAGNSANLSGAVVNPPGTLIIDTSVPGVTGVTASGPGITNGNGTLTTGATVTLTLGMSEAVIVAGGAPTLTLNDGGTATYLSGSGSNTLQFNYTVAAGQHASDLTVTGANLNGATIKDGAGDSANLSGAAVNPPGKLAINPSAKVASDFKGNGTSDILFRDPASGNFSDFVMTNGQPSFAYIGIADPHLQAVGLGDFQGDGTSDILLRDLNSGLISMFAMSNNQPSFAYIGFADAALNVVGVGDFNGDGTTDILLRDPKSGNLSDFVMNNGQPSFAYLGIVDPHLQVVGVGDFTGDGTSDILLRDLNSGLISMFAMADNHATFNYVGFADAALKVVGIGDFNGDGTSDILFRDPTSGNLSDFLMNDGQPTWSAIGWADPGLQVAGTGDYNGDGTSDILLRAPGNGGLSMFAMHSNVPSWAPIGAASPTLQVTG